MPLGEGPSLLLVTETRVLDWDGCYNVRDLGGLPTVDGGETAYGAFVRSAAPHELMPTGWAAAHAYGIRTVIDLLGPDQRRPDAHPRPADLVTVNIPLDDVLDEDFAAAWVGTGLWATAAYFAPFLARYPERIAAVVRAIAAAGPGGVLVHCGRGRDRTGVIVFTLLTLAGVAPVAIADDYEISNDERTRAMLVALGERDDYDPIVRILAEARTTNRDEVLTAAATVEVEAVLRGAGVTPQELVAVRDRLRPPGPRPPHE